MRFDLTDFRLFLHVVQAGSITHGAERAGLALPSASARIRGMEAEAGVALLCRAARGVVPTSAGLVVLRHARLALEEVGRMRAELARHARAIRPQVRLLANSAAASELLPPLLADWLLANPAVDLDLQERPSPAIAPAVAAGLADFGIAADWADLSSLQTRPFRTDRLVLVVPPGHPLAARGGAAFAEALECAFVGLGPDNPLQQHLAHQAARAGRAMQVRVHLPGLEAVCRVVQAGLGVAAVPEAAALRWPGLARVALLDPWAERRLVLCLRTPDALADPARRLVEHLAAPP